MLLGFKKQFVNPILNGSKGLTLRTPRKRTPKIGEVLYMYTALRTKHCEFITDKHRLKSIQKVNLSIQRVDEDEIYKITVHVDDKPLKYSQLQELVILDGFEFVEDWAAYWLGDYDSILADVDMFHWTDKRF